MVLRSRRTDLALLLAAALCLLLRAGPAAAQAPAQFGTRGAATTTASGAITPAAMRALAREVAQDYCLRAAQAERDGRPLAAQDLFARAIGADPGHLPGHLGYARVLAGRGHADEALHVVLAVPQRAVESDADFVALARERAALGDVDGALALLATRAESPVAARARVELASAAGRFPEALAAARHTAELVRGTDEERASATVVRALLLVVADADAVRSPGPGACALRRLLAAQ